MLIEELVDELLDKINATGNSPRSPVEKMIEGLLVGAGAALLLGLVELGPLMVLLAVNEIQERLCDRDARRRWQQGEA